MPDLLHSLQGKDLGHLKIIARLWNVEINAAGVSSALSTLIAAMLDSALVEEIADALPPDARAALDQLVEEGGRITWAIFTRRFGDIREMGSGKRDRERPYEDPVSAAEVLWYRGLIDRAFLNTPTGPQEFAYIPDDFMKLLPHFREQTQGIFGRPASPGESAHPTSASDRILDDGCTLLALLRTGVKQAEAQASRLSTPPAFLRPLLLSAKLIDSKGAPLPEPARQFLETGRGEAFLSLYKAWRKSAVINELGQVPGLVFEGEWENDPCLARQTILDMLSHLKGGTWWNLNSFIAAVKEKNPDFQRPGGDYDSWFIRQGEGGDYLRGFLSWDKVDGALIHYLITGPFHWLGIVDLAGPEAGAPPAAFRHSAWAGDLLGETAPRNLPPEDGTLVCKADGHLYLSPRIPRAARYQIARFCEWGASTDERYHFYITPASLKRAGDQGLRVQHITAILKRHSGKPIPPGLIDALQRWEAHGAEVRLDSVILVRFSTPEILAALQGSRAARFIGEVISPTCITVKPGAHEKLVDALAEMGYLSDVHFQNPTF